MLKKRVNVSSGHACTNETIRKEKRKKRKKKKKRTVETRAEGSSIVDTRQRGTQTVSDKFTWP
jgi:hypothetical protein